MKTKFLKRVLWLMIPLLTIFTTNVWGDQATLTWSNGSYTNPTITWPVSGVCTIVQERNGSGNTAPNSSYVNAPRWYSGNKITFTAESSVSSFSAIVITATSQTYATNLANSTYEVTGGTGSISASSSSSTVTITMTGTVTAFTIVMDGQSRLSNSTLPTITYTSGGGGSGIFTRVSNVSDLTDGTLVIFVNQAGTYACGTTQNTNNRSAVAITTAGGVYTYDAEDNVQIFTVKKNGNNYGFHTGTGYIYSNSNSNNYLQTNTTAASTSPSGTSAWTLSVSSNVFSVTNVTNTSYYLAFNGTIFSQYKSGMSKPHIYAGSLSSTVTVTFDANGHGTAPSSQTINSGETATEPTAPTATGYTFGGWYEEAGCTNAWNFSSTISSNKTLYAKWTANTISLTLNKNNSDASGSNNGSASVKYDATSLTSISHATRTGHSIEGYYAEQGCTNKALSNTGALVNYSGYVSGGKWARTTTPTTLYAKWNVNSYTLTWNLNGGTVTVAGTGAAVDATGSPSSSVNYGAAITTPTVEKEGYTFNGWNTTPASTMPAGNTTYTAQWTANQYTVTWVSNGSTVRTDNNVNHGTAATPPTISPLPCGDKLAGWTDAADGAFVYGTSTLYTTATITITANKTFYAVFADYDE